MRCRMNSWSPGRGISGILDSVKRGFYMIAVWSSPEAMIVTEASGNGYEIVSHPHFLILE